MVSQIRKGILLGIGIATLSIEKAKKFVKDLQKDGEIGKKDAEKLLRELKEKSKQEKEKLLAVINKQTKKAVSSAGAASKEEVKRLEEKIKKLEKIKRK